MKTSYSETILCACGCKRFARAHGKYHSDECARAAWNRRYRIGVKSQPEQEQLPTIQLPQRPARGPRCACGATLYAYEVEFGKCLKCKQADMRAERTSQPSIFTKRGRAVTARFAHGD